MSWSDPARRFEPVEDVQLRAELRDLLGLGPLVPVVAAQTTEATAELVNLAENLRQEAQRRSRTERKRPTWGLLAAAALPLLATLVGLGSWGFQQKHRADGLVAQTQRQELELTRLASTHATEVARERQAREEVQQQLQLASRKGGRKAEPYLVIPIEKPLKVMGDDYQRVKQQP
jgi:2'-5' RNA ligase